MSKNKLLLMIFTCVCALAQAQVNFVKNPEFEQYSECPDGWNKLHYANSWRNVTDSVMEMGMEYYNECGNIYLDHNAHVPENTTFFQYAHSGKGMVGGHFYNDKSIWFSGAPYNYRDNLQGHLIKPLSAGKAYCVSFWVNAIEGAGYVQNKLGAYLDDGTINSIADTPGQEITSVTPQVYTEKIIEDTMLWEKIEGSFVATGTETYISIGNFFKNSDVTTKYPNYWLIFKTLSYYLIDDVSVIPIDLKADAGKDGHTAPGMSVQIGRIGDTTAQGLDCKWYHKGVLIDSGAIISVNGVTIVGTVDTYIVIQTICGLEKTDTVTVTTVPVGIKEVIQNKAFTVFPNPSEGSITIKSLYGEAEIDALKIYDLMGRLVVDRRITLIDNTATVQLNLSQGNYFIELRDKDGSIWRERLTVK